MKKPARNSLGQTLKRGRRSREDRAGGRWRLSIREIKVKKGAYSWTTYLVQGWKDESGRWARRKFKSRAEAETFLAEKNLEHATVADPRRTALTTLTPDQLREAEMAVVQLAKLSAADAGSGRVPSLLDAVAIYSGHWRDSVAVERMPLREARLACIADKQKRGVLRDRSAVQLECTLKSFERWLCAVPRYLAQSEEEDWTPDACEVTAGDVAAFLDSLRSRKGLTAAPKSRNNARADLRGFFAWCCGQENHTPLPGVTRRWHSLNPAAAVPKSQVSTGTPAVLSVKQAEALMRGAEQFKEGRLVPYVALALFAGIRPGPDGELRKLAGHEGRDVSCPEAAGRPLIDLDRGVITIPAAIAKTGRKRVVTIQPNLRRWLVRYGTEILPAGYDRDIKTLRKDHALGHDVLRHSFISFHVAAFRSKASTALEAGNSETVIDGHYLNLGTEKEGKAFFGIQPAGTDRKIVPIRRSA